MKKLSIIALLLVVSGGAVYFLFFKQIDTGKIVAEAFSPYPNVITPATRSEGDAASQLGQLMALYDNKKYDEALKGFDDYLQSNPSEYDLKFYRGIIFLKKEKGAEAVADFEEVFNRSERFKDPSEWYLGLAYLQNNQKKEAAELMFRLAKKNNDYSEKADAILNKFAYRKYMQEEIDGI